MLEIGTAVTHSDMANHREGFVSAHPVTGGWNDVEVVFPDESATTMIPLVLAEKWAAKATHPAATAATVGAWVADAKAAMAEAATARKDDHAKKAADKEAFTAKLAELAGPNKGVIVAELAIDLTDTMTDYFAHKTVRRVVLGFTKSKRCLFSNMRKGAATFEGTEHLADGPKDFEHRDNYSMGAGNYLKDGWTHKSGWSVSIEPVNWCDTAEFGPAFKVNATVVSATMSAEIADAFGMKEVPGLLKIEDHIRPMSHDKAKS